MDEGGFIVENNIFLHVFLWLLLKVGIEFRNLMKLYTRDDFLRFFGMVTGRELKKALN